MFSPATPAVVPALGAAALRLLAVCRSRHGQAVGLSTLARLVGLPMERTGEELQELMYYGLVIYRSATEPLHAPASPPPATPAASRSPPTSSN